MAVNHKQEKLEAPLRVAELNPRQTLTRIGLTADEVVCDVGAGSGLFTLPALQITQAKVYALDISEEMLKIIKEKAQAIKAFNLELVKVESERFALPDQVADLVLLVTVLHEIADKRTFLNEVKRITKPKGRVAVIEFHKRATAHGPVPEYRLAKAEVTELLQQTGYGLKTAFDLGKNFYSLVFENQPE